MAEDAIDFSRISNRSGTFSEARNLLLPFLPFTFHFNKTHQVREEEGTSQEQQLGRKGARKRIL